MVLTRMTNRLLIAGALLTSLVGEPVERSAAAQQVQTQSSTRAQPEPSGLASPEGWLGIGLDCTSCGWMRSDRSTTPVWYGGIPTVAAVELNGPAARAGITEGDQLIEVFGRSIFGADSRQKFGAVKPGEKITFTVLRHGTMEHITVTAGPQRGTGNSATAGALQQMRYRGTTANAGVDIWSSSPVAVEKTADGTLIVRTTTSTIRIRPLKQGK